MATNFSQYCLATIVTQKAIEALLEAASTGTYRDDHPWLVARDIWCETQSNSSTLPILFASIDDNRQVEFSHWSSVVEIEVVELHRASWESRCRFDELKDINPIWAPIDSVFLKPSSEQIAREELEGIRVSRIALDEHHIHPYAICETPSFILDSIS